MMVENDNGLQPQISVSVLHKSVKLIEDIDKSEYDKKVGLSVIGLGLVAYITTFVLILRSTTNPVGELIALFIVGVLQMIIGYLLFVLLKTLRDYIR